MNIKNSRHTTRILFQHNLNIVDKQRYKTMAAKTVSSIIEMSRTLHKDLLKKIQNKESAVNDTRLSAALEYLETLESKTTEMIEEVPKSNRKNIMDTYKRYYPVDEEDEAQATLENVNASDIDSLMFAMVKVRQKLVNIYDFCTTDAQIPEVKKLMENIRDFEVSKLHEISRQLNEFQMQR